MIEEYLKEYKDTFESHHSGMTIDNHNQHNPDPEYWGKLLNDVKDNPERWKGKRALDFGCGCGYGSFIISKNPDVNLVHGIDISKEAIEWANNNFKNKNVIFYNDYENFDKKIDVLIAFEIIEHIKDVNTIPTFANKIKCNEIIISFP